MISIAGLLLRFSIVPGEQMSAKRRDFALPDSTFVNRKSLLVLMKTGWCFRDRAHAQTQQHSRARFGITLKVAV